MVFNNGFEPSWTTNNTLTSWDSWILLRKLVTLHITEESKSMKYSELELTLPGTRKILNQPKLRTFLKYHYSSSYVDQVMNAYSAYQAENEPTRKATIAEELGKILKKGGVSFTGEKVKELKEKTIELITPGLIFDSLHWPSHLASYAYFASAPLWNAMFDDKEPDPLKGADRLIIDEDVTKPFSNLYIPPSNPKLEPPISTAIGHTTELVFHLSRSLNRNAETVCELVNRIYKEHDSKVLLNFYLVKGNQIDHEYLNPDSDYGARLSWILTFSDHSYLAISVQHQSSSPTASRLEAGAPINEVILKYLMPNWETGVLHKLLNSGHYNYYILASYYAGSKGEQIVDSIPELCSDNPNVSLTAMRTVLKHKNFITRLDLPAINEQEHSISNDLSVEVLKQLLSP